MLGAQYIFQIVDRVAVLLLYRYKRVKTSRITALNIRKLYVYCVYFKLYDYFEWSPAVSLNNNAQHLEIFLQTEDSRTKEIKPFTENSEDKYFPEQTKLIEKQQQRFTNRYLIPEFISIGMNNGLKSRLDMGKTKGDGNAIALVSVSGVGRILVRGRP